MEEASQSSQWKLLVDHDEDLCVALVKLCDPDSHPDEELDTEDDDYW